MQRDDQVEAMVNRALARPKVYCQDCQFLRWVDPRLMLETTRVCGHPHALVTRDTSFAPVPERVPLEVRNAHNDCPDFQPYDGYSRRKLPYDRHGILPFVVFLVGVVALVAVGVSRGWWW